MKKRIFLLLLACGIVAAVSAQDVIVRTDGVRIEARVSEVSAEMIRYKRFTNPDGPTYVLPRSEVRSILYPNGDRDDFGSTAVTGQHVEQSALSTASAEMTDGDASATSPTVSSQVTSVTSVLPEEVVAPRHTYAVGDYYDDGTVRGVVCEVTDEGRHGLVLSLGQVNLSWAAQPKAQMTESGASATNDGQANMRAIERFIAANGLTWADFPAFGWCRDQGEGWYLPSIDELLRICANYNGGSRASFNREARNRINKMLQSHGGRRLDRLAYYLSSTERDAETVICSHVDLTPPFVGDIPKETRFFVRAVHKF